MDFALSELPFFPLLVLPEESTLSQFPFFSEDVVGNTFLPRRPSSVCDACWEGPFAMRLGLPLVSPRTGQSYQRWPKTISYSTTLAKMKFHAGAGCVWCQFGLGRAGGCRYSDERLIMTVYCSMGLSLGLEGMTSENQWISLNIDGENGEVVFRKTYMYTTLDDPAEPYFNAQNLMLDIEAPRVLALAKQQIDKCIHRHERCQSSVSPTGPRLLPKRLVDCTDPARPRLFSPTEEHDQYVALSYVWGEDQVHKTTTSNLSTYEHGITPSLLPATAIRDTIRLMHMLGFRALWVDSLCIIQDSDEDKLHEIGRMHHIYRYAHLTIIAASADRASEGFLYKRPPPGDDFAVPFICPPRHPISQMGHRDARPPAQSQVGQVYLSSAQRCESFRDMFGRMATRSWCLQEYLMSPRSLIFTPKAVLFRCCTAMVDVQVGHSPDVSTLGPWLPDALFLAIPPTVNSGTQEWKDLHRAWNEIVQNYSERTASDELDKLVACAAIAESFHHVLDSDYLAGLWRSDALLIDLLWSVRQDQLCTRPTVYRAPSWSWASVEGSIEHFPPEFTYPVKLVLRHVALAEVVDCRVTLEDPRIRFGRVTDGVLVLRGTPIPCCGKSAKQNKLASARSWNVPIPSLEEARRQQWGFGDSHSEEEDGLRSFEPTTLMTVDVHVDCDAEELPGRMWVVPFMRSECIDLKAVFHHGMVLELAPPSNDPKFECEKRRFRRIGHFQDFSIERDVSTERAAHKHLLWNPLTQAVQNRECPWMDIVIV